MKSLAKLILDQRQSTPQRTAVILQCAGREDKIISYQDLIYGASRYVRMFHEKRLLPGEVVVLILQHGEELIFSFWGAVLYGVIPTIMPFLTEKLTPERYREELTALIGISKPAAVVTYPEFEKEILCSMQAGDSVRWVINTDQVGLLEEHYQCEYPALERNAADIVLLQHSSGTTGLQKGVALSSAAIMNQLLAYREKISLSPKDVIISWLPLYHDMGLIAGFLLPMLSGIPLVLLSPFDWVRAPYRMFQAVSRYKGTLTWLPNFAFNFCSQKIRARDLEGIDLSSWRVITNCSEPVKWESLQLFNKRYKEYGLKENVLQCSYAMAENVFGVTQTELNHEPLIDDIDLHAYLHHRKAIPKKEGFPEIRMMSSGKALNNTEIRVVSDNGQILPERSIGEIIIQSNCMLNGYFNRPDATAKALLNGWYYTGDFGYLLDGELFVAGRKKELIIVGGKNVYPQDLENLAYEVTGIHAGRAVAFGIYDEKAGTEGVVIVAEVDNVDTDEQQKIGFALRTHISKNSAIALRHAHIVQPKWIIKTSSGKTARNANREKYLKEMEDVMDDSL